MKKLLEISTVFILLCGLLVGCTKTQELTISSRYYIDVPENLKTEDIDYKGTTPRTGVYSTWGIRVYYTGRCIVEYLGTNEEAEFLHKEFDNGIYFDKYKKENVVCEFVELNRYGFALIYSKSQEDYDNNKRMIYSSFDTVRDYDTFGESSKAEEVEHGLETTKGTN